MNLTQAIDPMIKIKDITGIVIFETPINKDSIYRKKLMGEDYITLKFNVCAPINFERGCYVDMPFGKYELVDLTYPTYNTSTGGYEYELRLDAYYWKWKNKILFYDRQGNKEAAWSLTRTPEAHLDIVCSNLKSLGYFYNGLEFNFSIDESVDSTSKVVAYDGTNIIDALTLIAETWDCEWWVEDNIIHLGKCEYNTSLTFELGKNVQSMSRSESNDNFATRIIAFGSTRNLPVNYRDNEGVVVENIVQKRLMLPVGTPYIDAYEGMSPEQAVESIVVFEDVYPRRIGAMSSVQLIKREEEVDNGDDTTSKVEVSYFRFKDTGLIFSGAYRLPGQELKLMFSSGKLNGWEFAVLFNPDEKPEKDENGNWNPEAQVFEIVRNEELNKPDEVLRPEKGDEYILEGFDTKFVSVDMLPAAELELKERAEKHVEKSKEDPSVYDCQMSVVDMLEEDIDLNIGHRVHLLNESYFKDGRDSRIYGFEKHLDGTKVSYTVGDTAKYSRLTAVEGQIKEITYGGNVYSGSGSGVYMIGKYDKVNASDRNVFSALRSLQEIQNRALSRLERDESADHITFQKGSTVENGLIVRVPAQTTSAARATMLVEEDSDMIVEEDEDALMEIASYSDFGASTLGGLTNVTPDADEVDIEEEVVLIKLKGASEWTTIPASAIGGGTGIQRNLMIQNNLDSRNIAASKGESCELKFTFISQERYGLTGEYENTGERGLCEFSIKNATNSEFTIIKQIYVQSGYMITIDIAEHLTSGINQVMLKITGEITGETTPALVYNVQLTSLSISADNFRWWTAFTDAITIPLNIGGNVSKTLHVTMRGEEYNKAYEVALGTAVYTETAYNYQLEHPGKTGVYNVSMYVANTDGSIRTRTIDFNIICAVQGDEVKLMAINNVLDKATNWAENTLFEYAMYDGENATTSAQFYVKKEGAVVFSSDEDSISTSSKHAFSLPLEVETIDNADFDIVVNAQDGVISLSNPITIAVDNSFGFSSVAGAVFYLNPRTRTNNQSNYLSTINEMTGEIIPTSWNGMNWGNDGWTTDNDGNRVLRIMASASSQIDYKPFERESARIGKTIEIDYKVDNVTDFTHPVIRLSSPGESFVGLRIFPDNVIMFSSALKNGDDQSINLFENKRTRITLVIMPDAYGNAGFNLCIIYINGVKNREFTYENNDYFAQNSGIVIGSDYADVDVYGMRVYDAALTSEAVLRNYINLLVSNDEKNIIQEENDVMDGNGSEIDFENTKDQYNVFVFDNTYPSFANNNRMKGTLEVYYADHPEWNVSITNVEARGQGTSSMRYWKWNVRFTQDKAASIITHADGSTSVGYWSMTPFLPKSIRETAKKNFASSMHSHKIGSVNSYDDLYRAMEFLNEAQQTIEYANSRVTVYQLPFVAFEKSINEEGQTVYTFMGLYTFGPDKGDANTFGYDTSLFPGLISIEGSDNAPLCALFRVPWNPTKNLVQYNADAEAWQYNGISSWGFSAGKVENISSWIPAYNIAYTCSNRIKPFIGTLDELNAQVDVYRNEPYEFWIAKAGDANQYSLYYYESTENRFMPSDIGAGAINLATQLVNLGYGLLTADLEGKTPDQLNELFVNARIQKFRKEAPEFWDIDDAIFHRNWVEFHAGTDNRAKNTYPYNFGSGAGKWKWRQDDLDTIFDTDNQGQAKKSYSVEIHDKYENGGAVWNGETSNFWNLIDLAFEEEIIAGMRKMMQKMEELSGLKSGTDFDKLYAYFHKYYFSQAQEYFPQNLYNADAKFTYEGSKLAYINGNYTNDTDPITQTLGDHYSAEQRWISKRILYMMSKYSFGLFSTSGTDVIVVRAAGNTINYELTPAMDMYPAIANGQSIVRGARTKAGEVCEMLIELSGSGDQQNAIQAASYLQDIGDWYNKNVTGSMIVNGRMLREIRLGSKTEPITISITSLTISNCVSLQRLILSRIETLTGTLNLLACTHLKEIYAGGTSLTQIVLPKGGGLELIEYNALNKYISLQNYPLLRREGVLLEYCKTEVTDFLVGNCPLLQPVSLLSEIIEAQQEQGNSHALKHVRVVGFNEEYYTADALDMLANLADGTYTGLDSEGLAGNDPYPVLDGTITVHSNYYQDAVAELKMIFNRLNLILIGDAAIRIKDPEVFQILLSKLDKENTGYILSEYFEKTVGVYNNWFNYNELIESFDEFELMNAYFVNSGHFQNCTNLKSIKIPQTISALPRNMFLNCTSLSNVVIPDSVVTIDSSAFENCTSLKNITLPKELTYIGGGSFQNSGITCVDFPESCNLFGDSLFYECITVETIIFRCKEVQIQDRAAFFKSFLGCTGLKHLVFFVETPFPFGFWMLNGTTCDIYVPDASVEAYKSNSTGWNKVAARIYPLSLYPGEL